MFEIGLRTFSSLSDERWVQTRSKIIDILRAINVNVEKNNINDVTDWVDDVGRLLISFGIDVTEHITTILDLLYENYADSYAIRADLRLVDILESKDVSVAQKAEDVATLMVARRLPWD